MEMTKKEKFLRFFNRFGWLFVILFATLAILALVGMVLSMEIGMGISDYGEAVYLVLLFLVLGIVFMFLHKLGLDFNAFASLFFIIAIPMFLLVFDHFNDEFANMNLSTLFLMMLPLGIIFSSAAALLSLSIYFVDNPISTRDIAEEGVLLAMAFILNLVGFRFVKGGGSVNLQLLPLFLIALRRGPAHGLICGGFIYGLVTCLTDGYGLQTYVFDYLIGFGAVLVLGLFRKQIFGEKQHGYNFKGLLFLFVGGFIATLIRLIGSTASSMILYQYELMPALAYNVTYIPLSGLFAILIIMAIYGPLVKINKQFPVK